MKKLMLLCPLFSVAVFATQPTPVTPAIFEGSYFLLSVDDSARGSAYCANPIVVQYQNQELSILSTEGKSVLVFKNINGDEYPFTDISGTEGTAKAMFDAPSQTMNIVIKEGGWTPDQQIQLTKTESKINFVYKSEGIASNWYQCVYQPR